MTTQEPASARGAGVQQLKVLVLEDDLPTCHALRKLLAVEGFDVRCGHAIADGLAMMAEEWPDVVLMDLMLADGDATGLIEIIRAKGEPTRIAVLTGSVDPNGPAKERLCRADQVFFKPIVAERLLGWFRARQSARI